MAVLHLYLLLNLLQFSRLTLSLLLNDVALLIDLQGLDSWRWISGEFWLIINHILNAVWIKDVSGGSQLVFIDNLSILISLEGGQGAITKVKLRINTNIDHWSGALAAIVSIHALTCTNFHELIFSLHHLESVLARKADAKDGRTSRQSLTNGAVTFAAPDRVRRRRELDLSTIAASTVLDFVTHAFSFWVERFGELWQQIWISLFPLYGVLCRTFKKNNGGGDDS